jgi:hypothetical protein
VSPILDSIGSVKGFGWGALLSSTAYESIMTATVSTAVGYVEFTSIPSTFTHLQIRLINDTSAGDINIRAQFNGDTGGNYSWHTLYADGGGSAYSDFNGVSSTYYGSFSRGGNGSGVFGASVVDILDYKNTNKYKTIKSLTGKDNNGGGAIWLSSGLWQSTTAISSIKIFPESGNFNQYSNFALYGIKGV